MTIILTLVFFLLSLIKSLGYTPRIFGVASQGLPHPMGCVASELSGSVKGSLQGSSSGSLEVST